MTSEKFLVRSSPDNGNFEFSISYAARRFGAQCRSLKAFSSRARDGAGSRKPKSDAKQICQIKALRRDPNTNDAEVAMTTAYQRNQL
ncbi:hypothetical protein soil367_16560 [Hydrocarboniclastica marina]|uniref:Uncharacterized protein n=1 Tax=Hydrocarboniclastica marina TaxID=2259620 RepID=A0A4P7XK63_9ALTE|nr:hypothetical protein soil367_16560 [Hydrocarboniclastica marina]